jgi:hypothetical protein
LQSSRRELPLHTLQQRLPNPVHRLVEGHRCLTAPSRKFIHAGAFGVGMEHKFALRRLQLLQARFQRLALRIMPRLGRRRVVSQPMDERLVKYMAVARQVAQVGQHFI